MLKKKKRYLVIPKNKLVEVPKKKRLYFSYRELLFLFFFFFCSQRSINLHYTVNNTGLLIQNLFV